MLRTYRWNHDVQFSLTSVPTGSYNVYVWTFEPNAPLNASLSIEQNTFLSNYSTGPAGHWDRLGPFPVTVADGNIQVQFLCIVPTDASFLSGVEVWQSSAPLQPPAGTFYRAINVGGPATVIDGHNWEGETTSNYTSNANPNPVSLKDPQNNLIPGTVSYDPSTHTVVLRPSSALNTNVTYTATIKGGPSGLSDIAGNRLPNDVSWSFATGTSGAPQAATPTFSPASRHLLERAISHHFRYQRRHSDLLHDRRKHSYNFFDVVYESCFGEHNDYDQGDRGWRRLDKQRRRQCYLHNSSCEHTRGAQFAQCQAFRQRR